MAENLGFLEQLGIPSTDERAILEAQRAEQQAQMGQASNRSRGRQARPLLIGGLNALGGLLTGEDGGRSLSGIGRNFSEGLMTETDRQTAMAAGISPEVLQSRREIRKEIANQDFGDPKAFESQIAMARRVAQIALKNGDADTYGKAISALSNLRVQKTEFEKLQATTKTEGTKAEMEGLVEATLDGRPVIGTFTQQVQEDGSLVNGLMIADERGIARFEPFGERLNAPLKGEAAEPLDQRIRKSLSRKEAEELRALSSTNASAMRRFDRVMTNVTDLAKQGRAETVLDTSGRVTGWFENAMRNIQGLGRQFVPTAATGRDNAKEYKVEVDANGNVKAQGIRNWIAKKLNAPDDDIWNFVQLPDHIRQNSADAQNYRAQIMELAYMVARIAEPSNRGLSDRDIINALERLGSSSNPSVIMTRFAEIIGDGAHDLETKLSMHHGRFLDPRTGQPIPDADINQAIVGRGYMQYRQDLQALQEKHGYTYDESGRAQFENPLDVAPGTRPGESDDSTAAPSLPNMSREEKTRLLFGPPEE